MRSFVFPRFGALISELVKDQYGHVLSWANCPIADETDLEPEQQGVAYLKKQFRCRKITQLYNPAVKGCDPDFDGALLSVIKKDRERYNRLYKRYEKTINDPVEVAKQTSEFILKKKHYKPDFTITYQVNSETGELEHISHVDMRKANLTLNVKA